MKNKDAEIISMMAEERTRDNGLRAMMDAYQSRLYWHIRRLVVVHDNAQDVLQDTFIKAYQNFHQFKQDSQLYTWLYRIATNEALQWLNKNKKMLKADGDAEHYMQNLVASNASSDADEIQILLQQAIQALPEKQRLVFTLRYYDELSYDELSKLLEMSVGTLKTNYHYAKSKIEDYIRTHYEK
ncbi:RNA polymerase sigma factor [Bergeyella sp. RCAD1439]|uniref:RNA polymerase sigma factor n=1 Tax=Bergeyella anatis TaxID=3113737 RepID=UPI002E1754B7|nr:sigma-70 family RNA polymerase sigma factor [Bergeyella sp. RCAD1439]